jgi:hypothetical protein
MVRFAWLTASVAIAASILVAATSAGGPNFPMRIDFPPNPNNGAPWAAEGIFGQGNTFWAGDTTNGAIVKGDVRTGDSSILVPAAAQGTKAAFGVFVDRWNRLWVAGGGAPNANERHAFVYDADTGALIKDITLATTTGCPGPPIPGNCFGIANDLTVTKDAAYITNTNNAANPQANVLWKVPLGEDGEIGTPTTIPFPVFGANGIEATPNGKTLIVAGFSTGQYFRVDTETDAVQEIQITENGAPASLPRGDGLILQGHTLYSALNLPNAACCGTRQAEVAVVKLNPDMTSGEVVGHLNSADDPLVNAATADIFGKYVYVVRRNAIGSNPVVRYLTRLTAHGNDDGD